MLENLVIVVARGELRHGIMHGLVLLVLHLQRHDGQAVEEEDEIDLLVRVAKVEMGTEGDAVFAKQHVSDAFAGPGLWDRTIGIPAPAL